MLTKDDILKISGYTDEKKFYKEFDTPEKFNAKYGKKIEKFLRKKGIEKAEIGTFIGGKQSTYNPVNYNDVYDKTDYSVTGSNRQIRMDDANLAAQQTIAQNSKKNGLFDMLNQFVPMMGSLSGGKNTSSPNMDSGAGAVDTSAVDIDSLNLRYGGYIPRADSGFTQKMTDFSKNLGQNITQGYGKVDASLGKIGGVAGAVGIGGDLLEGFRMMQGEKAQRNIAKQSFDLSNLTRQASELSPDITERRYLRPEDQILNPNELNNPFGVGTNVLARNGINIAQGEIQNVYSNGDIYSDMGYEPMNESEKYKKGGKIKKAQFGFDKIAGQAGGALGSLIGGGKGAPTGAGQIGSTIGSTVGKFVPIPGADVALSAALGLVGGIVGGKRAAETASNLAGAERNLTNQAFGTSVRNVLGQNSSYVKNGGAISSNYQPQIATELEGIPLTRLFAPDPYMDTLRTGGNIRQNNVGMDGDLRTHWGGGIETISRNPYRDGSGKIEIITGNSHEEKDKYGRTGVGISVGDTGNSPFQDYAEYGSKLATGKADVEAERNEPITEKMEPDGSISAVVHGNLLLSKANAELIGMPEYANTKIKDATAKIGDKEKKINKRIESSVTKLNELNPNNSYDLLSFNTEKLNIEAGNKALMTTADQTNRLANIQDAINRTADENGFDADALAKGKVKQAKMGKSIPKYQNSGEPIKYSKPGGVGTLPYNPIGIPPKEWETLEDYNKSWTEQTKTALKDEQFLDRVLNRVKNYSGEDAEDVKKLFSNKSRDKQRDLLLRLGTDQKIGPIHNMLRDLTGDYNTPLIEPGMPADFSVDTSGIKQAGTTQDMIDYFKGQVPAMQRPFDGTKSDKFDWMTMANQILPYLRPTNAEELDPRQLSGEMYALSTNQLQPVDAQLFQPQLSTPYDISLQDQLNANQSDYRAAQRMMGYNPAAQAMLNAQKYKANQEVLGNQFRMRQDILNKVYGENRQLLDQAKLQNLGILDQQYGRQQEALSNTKATTQAALNSISSKYLQNQSENRTLQTYENMYNYRFDPRFRAMNMNPLTQFNIDLASMSSQELEQLAKQRAAEEKNKPASSRNGSIVKSYK